MPIALMLKNLGATLASAAKALAPWNQIVPLEATIVERARSAFLVHWFGKRLPFHGLSLQAVITNMGELDAQFLAAQRSVPNSSGGPNLTGPLLGFAGAATGMLLSPIGAIGGAVALLHHADFSIGVLMAALAWVALPFLLGWGLLAAPAGTAVLVGGGLAGGGFGLGLAADLGDDRTMRGAFDLFGSLARFMNAGVVFLRQLTGPRSEVRNPLLRRILDLAEHLGPLFAQLLALGAVVIRRIGPVLVPVARTMVGLGALARATFAALEEVVAGLMDRLDQLTGGDLAIVPVLRRVEEVARTQLTRVRHTLEAQVDVIVASLTAMRTAVGDAFEVFEGRVQTFVTGLFSGHPVVRTLRAFKDQMGIVSAVWALPAVPPPAPAPPGFLDPLIAAIPPLPTLPPFPPLPALPDTAGLRRDLGEASVPPLTWGSMEAAAARLSPGRTVRIRLTAQARAAVARMAQRPSILASERQRLGLAAQPLKLNRAQLAHFREAFSVIVGRVLPPEFRATAAPQLDAMLAAIDHRLYGDPERPAGAAGDLPVLDLPTTDRLQPIVKTLRLRVPGADAAEARRFETLVTDRLRRQTYRAVGPVSIATGN